MKLRSRLTNKNDAPKTERVRIEAGQCDACKAKTGTRVYKTQGVVRYCVCDQCGHTWQKSGPLANPLIDVVQEAVEMFSGADIVKTENAVEVVLIDVKAATDLANRMVAVLP